LLGVMILSDLSLTKHVVTVYSKCFFWLRQLKRARRSLDAESIKTLVNAFVTSRVDYGNIILVGAPKSVIDKLQCVLNTAARIVTTTSSSSRMRVINHNWSAMKQRLHPQSVAEISRYSVLSGDQGRRSPMCR